MHQGNIKLYTIMKTNYAIKSQTGESVSTFYTSTTKRVIESMFNKLMRSFSKDSQYFVEKIRIGYSKVTYYGTYGRIETEYWICRA